MMNGLPDHPLQMPDHDLAPLPLKSSAPVVWLRNMLVALITMPSGLRSMPRFARIPQGSGTSDRRI